MTSPWSSLEVTAAKATVAGTIVAIHTLAAVVATRNRVGWSTVVESSDNFG